MKLTLRLVSLLLFITGIIWIIVSPGFDALTAFLTGILTLFTSFFVDNKQNNSETLDQRNRRILLNHVENFWVKGVLEKSLHGSALLELAIKEDPSAVESPAEIQKESAMSTLPPGTSMLEVFHRIGMGRSLLILGGPGSGKTTMLLELAHQLIDRARRKKNDESEPIPMVFNLASWTENLTLTDWLAQELNKLYSIPKRTAPDWVKGNKLLLLLDGLDEVHQSIRDKCVDAINQFRKEYGLTSLVVCSRHQDYQGLKTRLSFDGAVEVQPLTKKQITEYFSPFGKQIAGLKEVLNQDSALGEMAETPLFLSIMIMAYRDKQDVDILTSRDMKSQRKMLFNNYIERMLQRQHSKNAPFMNRDVLHWLGWVAKKMIDHNEIPYFLENMQPEWLQDNQLKRYKFMVGLIVALILGLLGGQSNGLIGGLMIGLIGGLFTVLIVEPSKITTVDSLHYSLEEVRKRRTGTLTLALITGVIVGLINGLIRGLFVGVTIGLIVGLSGALIGTLFSGLTAQQVDQTTVPGQKLDFTRKNFLTTWLSGGLVGGLLGGLIEGLIAGPIQGLIWGLRGGLGVGLFIALSYGGATLIRHYTLRLLLARNNLLPWKLVPFLNYCVDVIFLRRVGGGYIFIHRLLMEHFAEMYDDTPNAAKMNQL